MSDMAAWQATLRQTILLRMSDMTAGNMTYVLESVAFPGRYYTGHTQDPRARARRHNAGEVTHTAKYAPWQLRTYLAFDDERKAISFEKYLKSASGRAFARKRL